ncbi:MAG: hypothetical protein AAF449_14275, partial [Myxococcota bacterium]
MVAAIGLAVAGSVKKVSRLKHQARQISQGDFKPTYDAAEHLSYEQIEEVVQLIRNDSDAGDYILQWGRHFEIGFLAERKSTLRFVSTPALDILHDGFDHTDDWLDEVRNALQTKTPKFVIIENEVLTSGAPPFTPAAAASTALRMVLAHISKDYQVVKRYRLLTVLKRNSAG